MTHPTDAAPGDSVPVIAIDGPSASGKGTVAAAVARELRFHYLDSGALYRIVAWAALTRSIPLEEEPQVALLAERLSIRFFDGQIEADGENVTEAIRTEPVGAGASRVAALPRVRAALLDLQLGFRRPPGLVADGRDMGSVVFPAARLKVFLTARPEIRAERRRKQLMEKGISDTLPRLLEELARRDERDRTRAVAPLAQPPDAHLLDTSELSIAQAVATILRWFEATCSSSG